MRKTQTRGYAAGCALAVLAAVAAVSAIGCGGSGAASPTVPSISQGTHGGSAGGGQGNGGDSARSAALHAAAQCIREHGVPGYSDPVLTPSGAVYSDTRALQEAPQSALNTIDQACRTLLARAVLNPQDEPPAPSQLVQAGVRAAECLRAHGLPSVQDPTAQTPYTPGHGFGMTASEMPPGGKQSPVWQHARQACATQVDAEIRASTLGSLGNDG